MRFNAAVDALELSPDDGERVLSEIRADAAEHDRIRSRDDLEELANWRADHPLVGDVSRLMLIFLASWLAQLGCDSTSSTDREARNQEWAASRQSFWTAHSAMVAQIKQEFASRFEGQIEPGVGCRECPDMCMNADLRAIPAENLLDHYRQAAHEHAAPDDDRRYQLSALELRRLACIARGSQSLALAWHQLLRPSERASIRYFATVQGNRAWTHRRRRRSASAARGVPRRQQVRFGCCARTRGVGPWDRAIVLGQCGESRLPGIGEGLHRLALRWATG